MPDIEQRLRDSVATTAYPPTPDIAGAVTNRLRAPLAPDAPVARVGAARAAPAGAAIPEATLPLPDPRWRDGLPGQVIRLAAAIIAFVIVGGLMALVFQMAGDPRDRLGGGFETETVVQERLYVVSDYRFTAYNAETNEQIYWVSVNARSQTVFSPDSSRVYLVSTDNRLFAIRAVDGVTLWQGPRLEAVGYIFGGPPSLAISPDGSRLYVHNYRMGGSGTADQVPFWVQTIDAATGETIAETEPWLFDQCAARLHASPDNSRVYRVCWSGYRASIVDLVAGERQGSVTDLGRYGIAGSVQSADGRIVYVVTPGPQISILDTVTGEAREALDGAPGEPLPVHTGLVALSADGARLAIGIQTVGHDSGLHDIGRVIVYDTASWETVADLTLDPALTEPLTTGHAMMFSPDGATLYVAGTDYEPGTVNRVRSSRIVALDIATGAQTVVLEATEEISHVFTGRVEVSDDTAESTPSPAGALLLVDERPFGDPPRPLRVRPVDPNTMFDLPGAAPIEFRQHWMYAFSPDGRTLAAIVYPINSSAGSALYLIDVASWTITDTVTQFVGNSSGLLFAEDGASVYWVRMSTVTGARQVYAYDSGATEPRLVVELPEQFAPHDVRLLSGGTHLATYGVPTTVANMNAGDPRVVVIDLRDGSIAVDVELAGITSGQIEQWDDPDSYPYHIYNPGLAWDIERRLLYVAHADEDVITLVDLERGTTESTPFEPRRSLSERLLDWLAPSASAAPVPWTSRIALLSKDGERLFIAGSVDHWRKEPGTQWNQGWSETMSWTGVQVIDTGNLSEAREIDLPVVSDMRLSPDGGTLIAGIYVPGQRENGELLRTEQRIIGLSTTDLREVGGVEIPGNYTIAGFSADGGTLYINRQQIEGETPHVDLIALDLETWTTYVVRTFPETWFVELVSRE